MSNGEKYRDPEEFLKAAQNTEGEKGRLTIFFGAAPGVGKTYSMLQEAQLRKKEGVDVAVGYVELHGRKETEALLNNLETISPRIISYKGLELREMNLDGILRLKPKIVLVDELAHTNATGMRHEKRYQDIEELLNAGIDVYSTLNVQHLESLKDILYRITGVEVKETLPDSVFVDANEVKLIDLPTKDLLKRLAEGKVYVPEMVQKAAARFFSEENLLALRELALRSVADRVNRSVDDYRRMKAVKEPWPVEDKILVGVYSSPTAEQLIRAAYRFAAELKCKWVAVHVATQRDKQLSEEEKAWLSRAVELAKELGGEIAMLKGDRVGDELIRYAQDHNVTKIMMGKPQRLSFNLFFIWKILMQTKGIDVYFFSNQLLLQRTHRRLNIASDFKGYFFGGMMVFAMALTGHFLRSMFNETSFLFLMLLPVIVSALLLNARATIFSAILSVFVFNYLFVKPYFTFAIAEPAYFASFLAFLAVAYLISDFASRLQFQVSELRKSEANSLALYEFTEDLLAVTELGQFAEIAIQHIRRLIPCAAAVFFFDEKLNCVLKRMSPNFPLDEKEEAVALWVFKNGEPAGRNTKTLRESKGMYLPLKFGEPVHGVIGIYFNKNNYKLSAENEIFLSTIGRLAAMFLKDKMR